MPYEILRNAVDDVTRRIQGRTSSSLQFSLKAATSQTFVRLLSRFKFELELIECARTHHETTARSGRRSDTQGHLRSSADVTRHNRTRSPDDACAKAVRKRPRAVDS